MERTVLEESWRPNGLVAPSLEDIDYDDCPQRVSMGFLMILRVNSDYFFNINQLISVMEKCGVFFEVRTKYLNVI
jgi:hypothetical protein